MPLIPALGRQRHVDLCEFEASLGYRVSRRTGSKATEKPCLEGKKNPPTLVRWAYYSMPLIPALRRLRPL